ncbi:MAG: sugar phosphate isomerase/epimerase [Alphaproteobacteria bacterium]|nr:sugar phosphate isomerase/epimerase [Alphaproteobacteria bacterium]
MNEPHPPAGLVHRGLGRAEFFDLAPEQFSGLPAILTELAREGRAAFSFHAPVLRPDFFPYDATQCFFLNEDSARREDSFRLLELTLRVARELGAEYVVSHLTYGKSDTRDAATAGRLAREACRRFAELSRAHAIPLDIEFAGYTDSFHEVAAFVDVVGPHAELGICIDVGHTRLGAMRRGRDYLADIAALAPRARSMHLWNTTGPDGYARHHHVPLHPVQSPLKGWIDLPATLDIVRACNPDVRIVFEYPVERITPRIQAGYDWIATLAARPVRKTTGADQS